MGSDDAETKQALAAVVSTHAPAWGATAIGSIFSKQAMFQPTLPHGERLENIQKTFDVFEFQPTLPHGERHTVLTAKSLILMFQPTLPHGERQLQLAETYHEAIVSTHAPAWGATIDSLPLDLPQLFQPTLPHGERPVLR